jgi:hypothetical protein
MAYASVTYTSASGTTFALTNSNGDPIPYIRKADIKVYVNTVLQTLTTDYTFNTAGTAIVLNTPVSGATVLLQRITDIADPTVVYTAGSTLTAQDLNNADNQLRYGLQEFQDSVNAGGGVPDGDKGDIVVGGNGTIWSLDTGVVTETKIGSGAVTRAKILDGTIVNADISASAEIAVSKLADGAARQLLQTDAAGTGVEWTDNVDIPGTLDVTGNTTLDGNLTVGGSFDVTSLNGGPLAGARNRIINGYMTVDQRNGGASQAFTAGAALAYSVDRWYGYCTGANVTGQRVQGASAGLFRYRFTGAASVTSIGFGQRIEQLNSADLAGTTATLSVDLANSLLTTVTWTAFYANTADAFGTLASPTRTQIATGTFTVNSTVTRYSTSISIPSAATTGIEIVFTVGAQTSGTWTIGDVQLEPGTVATPFERRSFGQELALCQRYFERQGEETYLGFPAPNATFAHTFPLMFKAQKRIAPTIVYNLNNTFNVSTSAVISSTTYAWSLQVVAASTTNTSASTNFTANAEL